MAYAIELLPSAARELAKLAPAVQRRVARRIDQLARDPRAGGAINLRGADDVWRARIGNYRILYVIRDARLIVVIFRVAHRREAYR